MTTPSKPESRTGKHTSRLLCVGCNKSEGWCECPDDCDCLSCVSAELLEALKAMTRLMEIACDEISGWKMAGYGGKTVGENIHAANEAIAKAEGRNA